MALVIIKRDAWNPAPRRCEPTRRAFSTIREVFVHWPGDKPASWQHITTTAHEREAIRAIQHEHMTKADDPFCDIGYSHVLVPNWGRPQQSPRVYRARGGRYVPAGQLRHNTGTLALLVLMGPNDPLLDSVKAKIREYVRHAAKLAEHSVALRWHGEVVATECPGPKLREFVRETRR